MCDKTQTCIDAYAEHKHLHKAAKSIGVPWQTVYWHLKKAGVSVVGDKSRYGSSSDRLAARAEARFQSLIPYAKPLNKDKFQSKIDFMVGEVSVDVKCGRLARDRWAFHIKKQEAIADFFVCFAMSGHDSTKKAEFMHVLLLPGEMSRKYQTISLSNTTRSKWWDYEVTEDELREFFDVWELTDRLKHG